MYVSIVKRIGLEKLFIIFSLSVLIGAVLFLLVIFMNHKVISGIYVYEPNFLILNIERILMFFGIVGGLYTISKIFILLYSWIGVI